MYKKFFSVLATSAIIALPAFAADIPAREAAPAPAPVYAPPVFTWAGLYAGVNMGAGWRSRRSIFPGGNFLAPGNAAIYPFATVPVRNGGDAAFTAGLTLGYNWQFGNVVAGLEGDINYLGTGRQNKGFFRAGVPAMPFQVGAAPNTLSYFTKDNGRFFGTARARLGYAFDRTLFFATGGLAFRGNRQNNAVTFANAAGVPFATFANGGGSGSKNVGWTIGAGVEYAVTNNWTVKAEYLYANFGKNNRFLIAPANPAANGYNYLVKSRNDFHIARVGINYKF